jgi:glyoxalase family protein
MQLTGLHHVTAVTGRASENVAFYTQVLGLRLVKKTVNQDDVSAYHLFYGDDLGRPGFDLTFFVWSDLPPARPGAGTVSAVALRVEGRSALEYWARRLEEHGVRHGGLVERYGETLLPFSDPEGLALELVDDRGAPPIGVWHRGPVPPDVAIRGLHAVTLTVRRIAPTEALLTQVLGFRRTATYPQIEDPSRRVAVFETGPGGPSARVRVREQPDAPYGQVGTGGVHHVAYRTPDEGEQAAWQRRLLQAGVGVTPIIDRYYFKSIYFREPGHVLFEIATDGPGFATDEDPEHLGETLALPPFLEPRRREIEAGLPPIASPGLGR